MTQAYHFWDESQIADVDMIIILCEEWVRAKTAAGLDLANYHLNPYRVMAITDNSLDDLERLCSADNLPSPIKKSACLCYYTARERPLCHDTPDAGYCELEERIVNAKLAFDLACIYLRHSVFKGDATTVEVAHLPRAPSQHFLFDLVERLARNELPLGGLCMVLEAILYASNPQIAGIIDSNMEGRLAGLVEGFNLWDLYRKLSSC